MPTKKQLEERVEELEKELKRVKRIFTFLSGATSLYGKWFPGRKEGEDAFWRRKDLREAIKKYPNFKLNQQ